MRQLQRLIWLLPLVLTAACGTTLPDVQPFAASTAHLAASASIYYLEVANDLAALEVQQMPGEADLLFQARKTQIEGTQQIFAETALSLNRLFAAMTTYAEQVASLAAVNKQGRSAAQSILGSLQGFTHLTGMPGLVLGAAADPIIKGFNAIADAFTSMQAHQSLQEAVAAAEPGVHIVAAQFEVIYGTALEQAANGLRNYKRQAASRAAGPGIIGFHNKVQRNYNDYYRFLNGLVTAFDPEAPAAAWSGFCEAERSPCQAVDGLEALALVEARMAAIRPVVDAYEAEILRVEAELQRRRKASQAVIKAVNAWATEHQKLRRSLEDGTPLSAFNLRSALVELDALRNP